MFPEQAGFVRMMRPQELSVQDGHLWGVVAYLEPWMFPSIASFGGSLRQVPFFWDDVEPIPPETCRSVPAVNSFCPYTERVSSYLASYGDPRWQPCTESLEEQMELGETVHAPILIAGVERDYYEVVDVGLSHEGRTIRGVRLGRQTDGGTPVPQLVMIAGQHSNEWGPIETARRTLFRLASDYRRGVPQVRAALDAQALLVIPVLNPDGYDRTHQVEGQRGWRLNTQACLLPSTGGTDLNRNHPFAFGINNLGSNGMCNSFTYRGADPDPTTGEPSAPEAQALRAILTESGYRSLVLNNIHAVGGSVSAVEGFSRGSLSAMTDPTTACGDDDNCTAPDLGLFYRLAGTERAPQLHVVQDPSIPYVSGQYWRSLYPVNGGTDADVTYGTLPGGDTPPLMGFTIEQDTGCRGDPERTSTASLQRMTREYRDFAVHQLSLLADVLDESSRPLELPLLGRRAVAPPGDELPTLRVAARIGAGPMAVSNSLGAAGVTEADDVRPGAYYEMFRWRPDPAAAFVFPRELEACLATGPCRTVALDGGGPGSTDLCDPMRLTPGSAWAWTGAIPGAGEQCFYDLVVPGSVEADATLTSRALDLSSVREARLLVGFVAPPPTRSTAYFDVEVASNGFAGCAFDNYGACRTVLRRGGLSAFTPTDGRFRTLVMDIADFDGQTGVQYRIRVTENAAAPIPAGTARLRVYDAVVAGWAEP